MTEEIKSDSPFIDTTPAENIKFIGVAQPQEQALWGDPRLALAGSRPHRPHLPQGELPGPPGRPRDRLGADHRVTRRRLRRPPQRIPRALHRRGDGRRRPHGHGPERAREHGEPGRGIELEPGVGRAGPRAARSRLGRDRRHHRPHPLPRSDGGRMDHDLPETRLVEGGQGPDLHPGDGRLLTDRKASCRERV